MAAKTMLKRVGARTQPCFTPFVTGNESDVSPLSRTDAIMPSCNWRTSAMNFLGQPNFSIICHRPSLQTVKRLGQVNKCYEKVLMLLLAFLLQLAGSEDHINGSSPTSEAAFTLWK